MEDSFFKALPALIVGFTVSGALAYATGKASGPSENNRLVYGSEFKVLGWIGVLLAVTAIVLMFTIDHGGEYIAIAGIAALFGLLGSWLLIEAYYTVGHFDDQGITISSFWSRPSTGQWVDLREALFKKNGQYFKLVFRDGTTIRLSKILRGHESVCDHIESLGIVVKDRPKKRPNRF